MNILNQINYGYINNDRINIFEDSLNVKYEFDNIYHLMSPEELLEKNMVYVGIK